MATTWIKSLHIGRGRNVSTAIRDIIDYVENPGKTDDGRLITGYGCNPRIADAEFMFSKREYEYITGRDQGRRNVLAYHIRQSFKPGEIDAETANKIGHELALSFTKGKHAFVVSTHIDKKHIHNHIIFNSTNLDCDGKFKDFKRSGRAIRRISDLLCAEHGLSVIENPKPSPGRDYGDWIRKYICYKRKPPTEKQKQSWQTFLRNHAKGIWAMDFAVVPTLTFKTLYVLLIISHGRRKIEYFSVTAHPTAAWLIQQIRNATPFENRPEHLIHDNGQPFKDKLFQKFLLSAGIMSKSITPHSPWQNGICERLIGIVRRELLDHIIPLNQRHLERLLAEYTAYYNHVRTHQTLDGEAPVQVARPHQTLAVDTVLSSRAILGGLYHDYKKAA